MRSVTSAAVAVGLLFAASARADDQATARAVVEKAVKARGGEEKLAKHQANAWKGKGKFYGLGEGIEFTGEWQIQPPGAHRADIDIDVNGMKFRMTRCINGEKAWVKANDDVQDMAAEEATEDRHGLYTNHVLALVPLLKDKSFQLAPLGESKVGDRAVEGVKVAKKDQRDVNLFFDKETGLLLKSETKVKDPMAGGQEQTQESLYSDYKEADGVPVARKLVSKRDGKVYVEMDVTEYKTLDKIDPTVLVKP
jgi:hypothetical protein